MYEKKNIYIHYFINSLKTIEFVILIYPYIIYIYIYIYSYVYTINNYIIARDK